jgi:hypothetical protein
MRFSTAVWSLRLPAPLSGESTTGATAHYRIQHTVAMEDSSAHHASSAASVYMYSSDAACPPDLQIQEHHKNLAHFRKLRALATCCRHTCSCSLQDHRCDHLGPGRVTLSASNLQGCIVVVDGGASPLQGLHFVIATRVVPRWSAVNRATSTSCRVDRDHAPVPRTTPY